MPRPQKKRFVCCMPRNGCFIPSELSGKKLPDTVVMTVDEYETIRLIDFEGITQEDCSEQMHIARTTVQGIYAAARRKLADMLVNGKRLVITGGDYQLCGTYETECGRGCGDQCPKQQCCRDCGRETAGD